MILQELKLQNFRNYRESKINFQPGTNVIFGNNGQGKTNLLEAICFLTLTKSFRTSSDQNLILNKEPYFRIEGIFSSRSGRQAGASIAYSPQEGKRLVFNHQRIQKFTDYIGSVPIVLLDPSDLQISQGGPHLRRRFLDMMLSQASRVYLHHLVEYRRSLRQRNFLLQQETTDATLLQSWEEALLQNGLVLIQKRREAVEMLDGMIREFYALVSGRPDKIKVVYRTAVINGDAEAQENDLRKKIEQSRKDDLRSGVTSVGPHRDDLLFLINGKPLRNVGSQGEHKTFIIALKMAEFRFLREAYSEPPVLLFDDVFGELDSGRIGNMINELVRIGQVFITTTSPDFFGKYGNWENEPAFYHVEQGEIKEQVPA
ncbi:MAG: DNA replication/repair protein RecF [Calditrichia bacterium]